VQLALKELKRATIGSPCVLFHSKYKDSGKWDHWKAADFRYIETLHEKIPKEKWINRVYIQINNFGDYGKTNDLMKKYKLGHIFYKNAFWYFLPKYHWENLIILKKKIERVSKKIKKIHDLKNKF
jgi:hypothetical protein